MKIRWATDQDVSSIVQLLRLSLGESLMPKSEEFWRWKHEFNPFGKSPVLLAFDGDALIGVRAFMKWNWQNGMQILRSVRAVDTATHPNHQGKGIFKKLTMQLVEDCKKDGIDFVFNTPNKLSKPGYLKMGWTSIGRLPIWIAPRFSFGKGPTHIDRYSWDSEFMSSVLGQALISTNQITTAYSLEYLRWRYERNPNVRYHLLRSESKSFFVVFRIKPFRLGTELRICEVVSRGDTPQKEFEGSIGACAKDFCANVITFSGAKLPLNALRLKSGPVVTINPLNLDKMLSFDNWMPTLGDLELF